MIYRNISRKDYVALEGVNASTLKHYYESALNGNYEMSKPRKETEAMFKGTSSYIAIHILRKYTKFT